MKSFNALCIFLSAEISLLTNKTRWIIFIVERRRDSGI